MSHFSISHQKVHIVNLGKYIVKGSVKTKLCSSSKQKRYDHDPDSRKTKLRALSRCAIQRQDSYGG